MCVSTEAGTILLGQNKRRYCRGIASSACEIVVTFLTLVTTDTVSGVIHLVSRCPTQASAMAVPLSKC